MSSAITSSSVASAFGLTKKRLGPPITITMTVTPEMLAVIEDMGRDSGQPLELVFEQAIALYRAALTAHRDGKHVGLARSSDALDVEFTGFPGE